MLDDSAAKAAETNEILRALRDACFRSIFLSPVDGLTR
jgi:hypothetical protein